MKKLLFIAFICIVTSDNAADEELIELDNKKGPAYNFNNGGTVSCTEKALGLVLIEENIPGNVSDCLDLLLWDKKKVFIIKNICRILFIF